MDWCGGGAHSLPTQGTAGNINTSEYAHAYAQEKQEITSLSFLSMLYDDKNDTL